MTVRVQRLAALCCVVLLTLLLYSRASYWVILAAGALNIAWALANKFPPLLRAFFPTAVLVFNAFGSAYGVLHGGSAILAFLATGVSLVSWNAGLFVRRWPEAPKNSQVHYLRHLGATVVLGMAVGLSANLLQGHFASNFWLAFSLLLIGPIFFLRLIGRVALNEKR